jgi:flavin reductase (DIM6/NTAB) family NADH-FMN oxidoreductase RutF
MSYIKKSEKLSLRSSLRLITPGEVVLVTSHYKGKNNVLTVAWHTPVAHNPPMVGIAIKKNRYSHQLIKEEKEFVMNIPDITLLEIVKFCGSVSGREVNKFKEMELTISLSKTINSPRIEECIGWLECKVITSVECGTHTFFIGKIMCSEVRKEMWEENYWKEDVKLIHHLGGKKFITWGEI